MDMFSQEETEVSLPILDEPVRRESLTYEDIVKDFILEENQYLHDLNMIIKVFRAPFAQHFPRSKVGVLSVWDISYWAVLCLYAALLKKCTRYTEQSMWYINSLLNDKILNWSKLKAFADGKNKCE